MNWAVLFDWDGVIVDSSDYHEESWDRLAEEEGLHLPEDHFKKGFGMRNETIIPDILEWTDDPAEVTRLARRKEELYREIVREKGLQPLPGVEPFLGELHEAKVPCAVASSTQRLNITVALEQMGMSHEFQAIVAGGDVKKGKPDPEVFLTAAEKLGAEPSRCVVFEDAHVGVEAAKAAGMTVIGVATTHPAETLQDADLVVERLDELDLKELVASL